MPCHYTQKGNEWKYHSDAQRPMVDEAILQLSQLPGTNGMWYGITAECSQGCQPQELPPFVDNQEDDCVIVSTRFPYRLKAAFEHSGEQFSIKKELNLHALAKYRVEVMVGESEMRIKTDVLHSGPSDFTYLWGPILTMLASIALAPFLVPRLIKALNLLRTCICGSSSSSSSSSDKTNKSNRASGRYEGYAGLPGSDVEAAHESLASKSAILATASPTPSHYPVPDSGAAVSAPLKGREEKKSSERLMSLDTMRGLSLSLMIFVNYGGGGYWWLDHSSWNGLTVADLLFPWFMWMMGVSMALAFKARKEQQRQTRRDFVLKVLQRSFNLVAISIFTDKPWNFRRVRLTGVLQYFAFSYLWVALTVLATGSWNGSAAKRAARAVQASSSKEEESQSEVDEDAVTECRIFPGFLVGDQSNDDDDDDRNKRSRNHRKPRDDLAHFRYYWREFAPVAVAPLLWLILTFAVHVPGCGRGYLGPGGIADGGDKFHCTGGSHRHIDRLVLGKRHLYGDPTCTFAYQCVPYDPEGLVGMFNAVLLTYLGLVAGRVFLHHRQPAARQTHLCALGVPCLAAAAALCGCAQDGGLIPVNKNLWSTSYVLLMAGFGSVLLAFVYGVVDRWKWWSGAPLRYMGMNSIVIYVGSELFEGYFPFGFHSNPRQHWGELFSNCFGVCSWFMIAAELHRRKIFIKV